MQEMYRGEKMILVTTYKKEEKYLVDELEKNFKELMPNGKFLPIESTNKCEAILSVLKRNEESVFYIDNHAVIQSVIKMTPMSFSMAFFFEDGLLNTSSMIFLHDVRSIKFLETWNNTNEGLKLAINQSNFDQLPDTLCCPKISKKCRIPIIIFNKSRRYTPPVFEDIPNVIGASKIRKGSNGSITLTRRDPIAEEYLNRRLKKLPNQLIWVPK